MNIIFRLLGSSLQWLQEPAHVLLVLTLAAAIAHLCWPNSKFSAVLQTVASNAKTILGRKPTPKKGSPMFVVLVNHDTARSDITPAWLNAIAAAFTKDLTDSFLPEYGLAAWSVTTDQSMPGPRLAIFGKSDVPGALGYHDVGPNGLPYGDAFADGSTLDELSETLSHELKELIGDLYANRWRVRSSDGKGYAEEACDAVQGTPYRVNGVLCANHVTQAWYQEGSKGPWDKQGQLTGPMTRTDEGYLIVMAGGQVSTEPMGARMAARKLRANSRTRKRMLQGRP